MSLLWILISNLSNVAVPSPHGDFLVVTLSFFVGRGIGPRIIIPDFFAISFTDSQILLRASISILFSFILTIAIVVLLRNGLKMFLCGFSGFFENLFIQ